jgi:AAHS family 4-hydroxybenzoate transporter-like MFS transporter
MIMTAPAAIDVTELLDRNRIGSFQIRVVALCAAVVLLDGFDAQVIGYLAPAIGREWQLERAAMTPVFTAGLVGLMVGALTLGPLADWIGRKAVIIGSTLAFGIMSVMTAAMADSVDSLAVLRFLTGIGLGGAMPNAIAMTAEYGPKRARATMVMVMFCGFPIGASLAGFSAAQLISTWGWRSVFYLGGLVPIVLVPLLVIALPESIRHLVLKGSEATRVGRILARIVPGASFAAGTRFAIDEERGRGVTVVHLFRERRGVPTALLWIVFFVSLMDIFLIASWLPTVAHDGGLTLSQSVVATALFQAGGVIGSLGLGRVADRFGSYRVLAATYFGAGAFIALIGVVASSATLLMIAAFAAGVCLIGGQVGANVLSSTFYPTFMRSTGVGWALGIGRIGSIVGPVLGGKMLMWQSPAPAIFAVGGAAALCASLAVFAMGQTVAARAADKHGGTGLP